MNESASEFTPGIIERTGPHAGKRHPIGIGTHVIGRGSTAAIDLDDPDVSRHHARVEILPDRASVEDLGSKNGVFFAEEKISGESSLSHGDHFEIGGVTLELDHPGAGIGKVLAAGGETTMTRTSVRAPERPQRGGLLLPVLGILVFGGIVVALVLWG